VNLKMKNDEIDILIVEDSPTQAEKLRYLIEGKGYGVRVAIDGAMALAAIKERKPNLVLSDIVMPGMDGYTLCRTIKEDENWRDVPIILVTSLNDPKDIIHGLECGADNFIRKPYADAYLLARIEYVLMNQELRSGKNMDVGIVLYLGNQKHFINSQRQQILDLLISTYEQAVFVNDELHERERQVIELNMRLAQYTTELEATNRIVADKNIELEHASRAKSEFLANMSHELRTPLNAILGFSEALKDGLVGPMEEQQREYITDIYESGGHLLSLINDILDLAKIEAGKMELELVPTNLKMLLENSASLLRERAHAHSVRLTLSVEPIESALVDQRKFKQIVFNLVSNAIKFTPAGGDVMIALSKKERALDPVGSLGDFESELPAASGQYIELCVTDNGIGIEPEALNKLFQPFVQLDSGLTRKYEGSGLGLAIVKQLVELHNGTMEVKSIVGSGSYFAVSLPYIKASSHSPVQVLKAGQ
jgi:two-component system sensor histidine kinase/response regulator